MYIKQLTAPRRVLKVTDNDGKKLTKYKYTDRTKLAAT